MVGEWPQFLRTGLKELPPLVLGPAISVFGLPSALDCFIQSFNPVLNYSLMFVRARQARRHSGAWLAVGTGTWQREQDGHPLWIQHGKWEFTAKEQVSGWKMTRGTIESEAILASLT